MADEFQAHSPLGASSAERWMNCPGSTTLLRLIALLDTDEPDYRRDGIAAHEAAAFALKNKLDAWEIMDQKFHDTEVTEDMANAVQMYLDHVRSLGEGEIFIEQSVGATQNKTVHRKMYGTVDYGKIKKEHLDVVDYKHGEGIVVEALHNPQLMYYALAFLLTIPNSQNVKTVRLTIVQPRAWHADGPIRCWNTTADEILAWGRDVLVPAMEITDVDEGLQPGKWCRFCPAKLVCPALTAMYAAAARANIKAIPNLTDERLGAEYALREAVKFYMAALEQETMRRSLAGATIPGVKTVPKRSSRVFKPGADKVFYSQFGVEVFTKPELKSPAEMEKVSPAAKKLVHEWSFMPRTGLTIVSVDDPRPAVKIEKIADVFKGFALDNDDPTTHNEQD